MGRRKAQTHLLLTILILSFNNTHLTKSRLPVIKTVVKPTNVTAVDTSLLRTEDTLGDSALIRKLQEYCPLPSTCRLLGTTGTERADSEHDGCCGTCSCSKNCAQQQSCCDDQENQQNRRLTSKRCVSPYSGWSRFFDESGLKGVMMVTVCADKVTDCLSANFSKSTIAPVSSPIGETYVNQDCAKCNNVSQIKDWDMLIISNNDLSDSFHNLFIDASTSSAAKVFFLNESQSVETCDAFLFSEKTVQCKNKTLMALCKTLYLPYQFGSHVYKNIFCHFCRNADPKPRCFRSHHGTKDIKGIQKMISGGFSAVLDSNIKPKQISSYFKRESLTSTRCPDEYIPHPAKKTCVPIFCPIFQISNKGQCVFVLKTIKTKSVKLKIMLNKEPNLIQDEVLQQLEEKQIEPSYLLRSKCLDIYWDNIMIFMSAETANNRSLPIHLTLIRKMRGAVGFNIKTVLNTLRYQCLTEPWQFNLNGTWVTTLAEHSEGPWLFDVKWYQYNWNRGKEVNGLNGLFEVRQFHYCKQERLQNENITHHRGSPYIHIQSLNLTLTSNNFLTKTCIECENGYDYYICAKDFNPTWWLRHGSGALRHLVDGHALYGQRLVFAAAVVVVVKRLL